jgi:CO/xanthine dehydrogenase FAD-binding subunit
MVPFNYLKARDAHEASGLFNTNRIAEFIAGGTNLIDLMKENVARPETLIDINQIDSFQTIKHETRRKAWRPFLSRVLLKQREMPKKYLMMHR